MLSLVKSMCYNTSVMEFDPFARNTPETPPEDELVSKEIDDKTARIRRLAVSKALEPSLRRQGGAPNISLERHPEAFNLQPIKRVAPEKFTEKSAENKSSKTETSQLTTPELLQIATKLSIEGQSVRAMYENNQIDYRGLHAIIKEALRGGNIKAVFEKYELGEEARRGRKIEMRHDDPSKTPHVIRDFDAPSQKVSQLIEKVEAHSHRPLVTSDISETKDIPQQSSLAEKSHQKAKSAIKLKRVLMVTFTLAIGLIIGIGVTIFIYQL